MFTGLIQDIGCVKSVQAPSLNKNEQTDGLLRGLTDEPSSGDAVASLGEEGKRITITTGMDMSVVPMGASIACGGVCLTVVEKFDDAFAVDVSVESLSKTNIGEWVEGQKINLEPSLKMGDELGGHFVFGHVDGLASLDDICEEGGSYRLTIKPPVELMAYVAPKGSISLDGISLTVNEVGADSFGVNIIPHTWAHTTLSDRAIGDQMNIEIDMLARYVARQLEGKAA